MNAQREKARCLADCAHLIARRAREAEERGDPGQGRDLRRKAADMMRLAAVEFSKVRDFSVLS